MRKFLAHIFKQPFVFATGLAALIHSTWSLGTLFSGEQPAGGWQLVGWLIPAFLIAFSLDVGQIVTSAEIRAGQRSKAKYATFAVFALATYYLQWTYIAAHMPAVKLGAGVRVEWLPFVSLVRDLAVFIIPALLPLSTMLYTSSHTTIVEKIEPRTRSMHRPLNLKRRAIVASASQQLKALVQSENPTKAGEKSARTNGVPASAAAQLSLLDVPHVVNGAQTLVDN
jgi:hypothetical protein